MTDDTPDRERVVALAPGLDWRVPPRFLYKYMSLKHAETLLGDGKLYLSNPLAFNDPFDSLPNIVIPTNKATLKIRLARDRLKIDPAIDPKLASRSERRMLSMKPEELRKAALANFRDSISRLGVYCMSERCADTLMWSHYADHHRGICVGLDMSKWDLIETPMLFRVAYSDQRQTFEFPRRAKEAGGELFRVLTYKSPAWREEREWRLIRSEGAQTLMDAPPGFVDHVIMGALCTDQDAARISGMLSRGFPKARIRKMSMDHDTYNLAIREGQG